MRRFILFIIAIFALAFNATAQKEVDFKVAAPRMAVVDQYFKVEFSINVEPDNMEDPDFGGLEVVAGPIPSESTFFEYVNGKSNSGSIYTYTYGVVAHKEGIYTIKPVKATVGNKTFYTKSIPIEAVRERSSRADQQQQSQGAGAAEASRPRSMAADDVLLRLSVNKSSVYKGEPLLVTVKLYDRVGVVGVSDAKEPSFNNFWKQTLEIAGSSPAQEAFNGKVYQTQVVQQYLLFPQKSGTLEIEQMDLTVIVRIVTEQPSAGGIFGSMFGGAITQDVAKELKTAPIKITVKDLPTPAPASFSGAVGQFTIDANVSNNKVNANSSSTLNLRLSGSGNLPMITTPDVVMPATFDAYPSKSSDSYTASVNGTTGSKTYEYPFIPRAEGNYTIAPIEFTFFDPNTSSYKTIKSEPFDIDVLKDVSGSSTGGGELVSGVTKEQLKILGKDIHFIRVGEPSLKPRNQFFVWSLGYIAILVGMVALCAGVLIYLRRRIKLMRDTARVRNKQANKVALRRLKESRQYMNAGKETQFYEEMMRALYGYTSDKLNIPVSDLSKDNIKAELLKRNVSEADVEQLLLLLSDCELARFSPGASIQMGNIYSSSLDLIGRFESKL